MISASRAAEVLARYRNAADLQETFMPKRPAIESMVHDYVTDVNHTVALCPHCASMGDHGHGGLTYPLSTTMRDGECCGAMHDGIAGSALHTALDAEVSRLKWARTHGRTFSPWQVCSGINRGLADGMGHEVLKAGGDL